MPTLKKQRGRPQSANEQAVDMARDAATDLGLAFDDYQERPDNHTKDDYGTY